MSDEKIHQTEIQDTQEDPKEIELNQQPESENKEETGGLDIPEKMPLLVVRDITIFNYMILPLFVGREKSVHAVDAALNQNRYILVCAQKDEKIDDPTPNDIYHTGTVALIMRMLKMPDGRLKVLIQGIQRAKIKEFTREDPFYEVKIDLIQEKDITEYGPEVEALIRAAREQSEKILNLKSIDSSEIMAVLNSVDEPGRLADLIASNLRMKPEEAQKILECEDPIERLKLVNQKLAKEVEVATMQAKIQSMAKEGMDKAQREFFLREQLKAIRKELGELGEEGDEIEELRKALKKAGLPKKVFKEAEKQLNRLSSMHPEAAEATVIRTYLEWLVELPWKKATKDRLDIKEAEKILNEDHYDLDKVKERILEYLSVRKLNPKMKGPILCFVGPPGVGKTSLGKSIARALNRKFVRMSLGGMRDEAEIRGHRRTYIGSMPGRIIQGIKEAGSKNPVFMLDEIDKLGNDFRGDPASALLEVLDPEQNNSFTDHYLNVPFDLSKVMFICTANMLDTIPSALLDRMEVIRIPGYTEQEKVKIAEKYLLPRQIKENGLQPKDIQISSKTILKVIREYTREAGLRNLERELGAICRKIARKVAEGQKGPFRVTTQNLHKFLGVPKFLNEEKEKELPPGVALGLAWTPVGGEVLNIEVSVLPGKGKLLLTGQLGDIMKESAQAALSYARTKAKDFGFEEDFAEKKDIHIHVPAGATPKDEPSAGVTISAALMSALTEQSLPGDIAMTGEITLRGRVLPVGGIKEKILAAVTYGLSTVVIPKQNLKDLQEIPKDLRKKIKIETIEHVEDLWNKLGLKPINKK
ncbi:ATP-dependent proteinase. Serine peptidase. MEROPS family S16 [Desulfonauticus submarinus]|uniref:Lon protease n=1 Tax=Desulfonauticus submarinus TaxID=206665 RepID=A0A1H0FUD6_9BACT|nr:endopeptidase La [Desulfonauticus submarinus]SDN98266.1 ATP-dependent proteinase. Serine peptidase. MEROPS family S16 [Desulfonauticus submarinus]